MYSLPLEAETALARRQRSRPRPSRWRPGRPGLLRYSVRPQPDPWARRHMNGQPRPQDRRLPSTRVAIDSASEDSPRSGFAIATTVWPSLFSSRITPPNPDASANAPCTRTIVAPGTSLGPIPLPIPIRGCDMITPFRRGRIYLRASHLRRVPIHSYARDRLDTILR